MIFLAFGANLPSPVGEAPETFKHILAVLPERGIEPVRHACLYRSSPVPASDQPDYINTVFEVDTELPPELLLTQLHLVEEMLGRMRTIPNAARPVDLDILLYHDSVVSTDVIIPHPRMTGRSFVMLPLAELAPELVLPHTGKTVQHYADLLKDDPGLSLL